MTKPDTGISRHSGLLTLMTMGHLVNDFVAGALWIIAPAIAASMGLGPAEVGLILTVYGIAAGLIYIPAGFLADRISNQGVLLLISFWWVAVGYFLATLVPGFWPITLMLALGVMGDAFWHPVATGVLVKNVPERRAQVLGIHAMGGSVGAEMLGPLCAGFLLGYFSWESTLQLLLIAPVGMGLLFLYYAPKIPRNTSAKITVGQLVDLVREWLTPRGTGIMVMMIAYNMSLYGMLAMSPLTLQEVYGFNPFYTSVLFAVMLVFGTICQPFIGQFSDRVGRKSLIVGVVLTAAACALAAGLFQPFLPFITFLVLSVSLLTAIRPVILAAAVEFSGKSESTTLGVVFSVLDGVGAAGALAAGYFGEFQLHYAFIFAGVLALVSSLVAALISLRPVRSAAAT